MKIIFIYKGELKMDDYITADLLRHPKKIVDRLNKAETESVLEKCDTYKKLDKNEDFKAFWEDIRALTLHHQERLVRYELKKRGNFNIQSVIGEDYNEDVEQIIKGKTTKEQLEALEAQAKAVLNNAEFNLDAEFWEQVLTRLQVQKAVLSLEAIHDKYFECKDDDQPGNRMIGKIAAARAAQSKVPGRFAESLHSDPLSPRLYNGEGFGSAIRVLSEEDYKKRLDTIRTKSYQNELAVLVKKAENEIELRKMKEMGIVGDEKGFADDEEDDDTTNDEAKRFKEIMKQAENKMEDDEIAFDDIEQTKKTTDWIDKFRPRKPHYFNRVKMGYEWNRVNQAHYDLETPPPKMVLGYKFNLFYPKLLDKSKTPTYELVSTDNPEFCIIKFMAGPPYEDISFKIVNREWDLSDRQGFKCIFDRGILHLHFNFKMARYRR